jgi:hypothetical protein
MMKRTGPFPLQAEDFRRTTVPGQPFGLPAGDLDRLFLVDENLLILNFDRIALSQHAVALTVDPQRFVPDFHFDLFAAAEDVMAIRRGIRHSARVAVAARLDDYLMTVNHRLGFIPGERVNVRATHSEKKRQETRTDEAGFYSNGREVISAFR